VLLEVARAHLGEDARGRPAGPLEDLDDLVVGQLREFAEDGCANPAEGVEDLVLGEAGREVEGTRF
jgi:hypothetical protein